MRAGDPGERIRNENKRATTTSPRVPHKMFRLLEMWITPYAGRQVSPKKLVKLSKSMFIELPKFKS